MPGISPNTMVHKLNVYLSFPTIQQKKRVLAQERDKAIAEEVRKLLEANFIREVYYSEWLANVDMVKKANDKWRMCVDFTNQNKACLKDSYPLLRIDLLVDSMAGHQLLSFMDAFSGYNQIKLDEANQEKTSFVTSQGLFLILKLLGSFSIFLSCFIAFLVLVNIDDCILKKLNRSMSRLLLNLRENCNSA